MSRVIKNKVDGTVSSPPYATALPYVDTYRLSMVALGLIYPNEITKKEKQLIGARDITKQDKNDFEFNIAELPIKLKTVIRYIMGCVHEDKKSGFRKKAAPYAYARYYASMLKVLKELYTIEKKGSPNLWVLGPNRIGIGKSWYNINTPELIGEMASQVGFKKIKLDPVQAYNRYGLHSKNAISKESILQFYK
jgi:site-specific DNA-methyltransferase (cytosine-N4-specific)